jgi:hypothetical protein
METYSLAEEVFFHEAVSAIRKTARKRAVFIIE